MMQWFPAEFASVHQASKTVALHFLHLLQLVKGGWHTQSVSAQESTSQVKEAFNRLVTPMVLVLATPQGRDVSSDIYTFVETANAVPRRCNGWWLQA